VIKNYLSVFSQMAHYIAFSCKKPSISFDKGLLIFSIDVDVGSQELGERNRGKNDLNVHDYLSESVIGRIEEQVIPLFVQLVNDFEVPVTFALRGQLTEVNNSIIDLLLRSPIEHDIGAHGYYHNPFTMLSKPEAENELRMISMGMKKFNTKPTSFVFPKNKIAHLNLLEKYGYTCFRGYGGFKDDGMYVKKHGSLYDIHPGFYLGYSVDSAFLNKIINISVRYKLPFHVWLHAWNFGQTKVSVNRMITKVLFPFLKYAKKKQRNGVLAFETMRSITEISRSKM